MSMFIFLFVCYIISLCHNCICFDFNILLSNYSHYNSKDNDIPVYSSHTYTNCKIVWIFWDSIELPKLINDILQWNKRIQAFDSFDIRFLSEQTLDKYIENSAYPVNYDKLKYQHKSDWLRLYLLLHYGGVWIDASIIFYDKYILQKMFQRAEDMNCQLVAFYAYEHSCYHNRMIHHSSGVTLPFFINNFFLIAPKGSELIRKWLDEYILAIDIGFDNYLYFNSTSTIRNIIKHHICVYNSYHTNQLSLQKVLENDIDFSITSFIFYNSDDSLYKYHNECNMNTTCIIYKILGKSTHPDLHFIKLNHLDRSKVKQLNVSLF